MEKKLDTVTLDKEGINIREFMIFIVNYAISPFMQSIHVFMFKLMQKNELIEKTGKSHCFTC